MTVMDTFISNYCFFFFSDYDLRLMGNAESNGLSEVVCFDLFPDLGQVNSTHHPVST